jgi:hypothetical protein
MPAFTAEQWLHPPRPNAIFLGLPLLTLCGRRAERLFLIKTPARGLGWLLWQIPPSISVVRIRSGNCTPWPSGNLGSPNAKCYTKYMAELADDIILGYLRPMSENLTQFRGEMREKMRGVIDRLGALVLQGDLLVSSFASLDTRLERIETRLERIGHRLDRRFDPG